MIAAGALALIASKNKISGISSKTYRVVGRVVSTRFRNASYYGNPSYYVTIETQDGQLISGYTSPNALLGYSIESRELAEKDHVFVYTVGKNGAIFHYEDKY